MRFEKKDLTALFAMAVLCLLVRLNYYTGVSINDDLQYIDHAVALSKGFNIWAEGGSQLAFRTGMVIPLAVFYKLLGFHEYTFIAYPIICSIGACLCIFMAAFKLWGLRTAIISSLLWVIFPLQVCYDTQLSTAPQLALCVAGAFLCFIEAQRFHHDTENQGPSWKYLLLYFCCGIILGLGWLVSELFCLIVFTALALIVFVRPAVRSIGLILAGFIFVFCLELVACSIFSGSPWARIHSIQATEAVIQSNREPDYLPRTMFTILNVDYFNHEGHFGIQWYLFIIFTMYAFFVRDRLCMGIASGVVLVLAYLQWGFISPDLTPITKYIRYLSITIPFVCILSGWVINRAFTNPSRLLSYGFQFLFLIYCFHCLVITKEVMYKNRARLFDYREAYRIIVTRNLPQPIFTDNRTRHYLRLYSSRNLDVKDVEVLVRDEEPPGTGTLVKNCSDISRNQQYREQNTPWWYQNPPSHWVLFDEIMARRPYEMDLNPRIYIIRKK